MKPIVVLDTNVILDILVFEDPKSSTIRLALEHQSVDALRSHITVSELADVIARPAFALSAGKQAQILQLWQSWSRLIEDAAIDRAPMQCRDPDDQIFIDLAYSFKPALLLSKDLRVLELRQRALREQIEISDDYTCLARLLNNADSRP